MRFKTIENAYVKAEFDHMEGWVGVDVFKLSADEFVEHKDFMNRRGRQIDKFAERLNSPLAQLWRDFPHAYAAHMRWEAGR